MKVILAAGGSGGHIFPAIALAKELRKKGVEEIAFVSSKRRLDKNILDGSEFKAHFLSVNPMPFNLNPIRLVSFSFKLFIDTLASLWLLIKIRPNAVVGFGGYSSGTISICSKLLGITLIIHEQNFLPGRANRLLSWCADCIAVSFLESMKYFKAYQDKLFHSGNPIRLEVLSNDREKSLSELDLSSNKKTILIMGGSQGSTFLNETASKMAQELSKSHHNMVQFIHITGKNDYNKVLSFYSENKISGKVFSFMEQINNAYALADLAISRAGAAAIFELAYYSRPMIIVPYPNPKNNQRSNARYFSDSGAAICKEEKTLTVGELYKEVSVLIDDEIKLDCLAKASSKLSNPTAGEKLAEKVIEIGRMVKKKY